MKNRLIIWGFVALCVVVMLAVHAWAFMTGWNTLVAGVQGFKPYTFWQSVWICVWLQFVIGVVVRMNSGANND